MNRTVSILCVLMMSALFLDKINAQNNSLGATFSYAGTGLEYSRKVDKDHFVQYQLRAETTGAFWSSRDKTGISASAFWNTVIKEVHSRNDNRIRLYAGPGISIGYASDIRSIPHGVFLGLKGRVGTECEFARGITLSGSLSPMIGGHFTANEGMINMRLYRTGLYYGVMPEIGIRYNF